MPNIVLVGAGGAGVSSLGGLLLELGFENVIGVNNSHKPILDTLTNNGAQIYIGHGLYEVAPGDIVVYSAAAKTSIEVQTAFNFNQANYKTCPPPMLFHECMGEISKYFRTVAVTGTHGKSSTSSLASYVLACNSEEFGVGIIGAQLTDWDGKGYGLNTHRRGEMRSIFDHIFFRKGQPIGELMKRFWFVIEADEFNKHFLFLDPDYAIITSCELDHLDTYGTQDNYFQTFLQFMQNVRHDIFVPAHGVEHLLEYIADKPGIHAPIHKIERTEFDFSYLLGGHNHMNASLVHAALSTITHIPTTQLTASIEQFRGIQRRAELLGTNDHGVRVYSDYGHHPTELASTISAFRHTFPDTKIHVLFEPHQMARVVQFREQFLDAMNPLEGEQRAYFSIFAARETVEGCREVFPQDGALEGTAGVNHLYVASSSDELSQIFADQGDAPLLMDQSTVQQRITDKKDGMIVFFSAGKLDKMVREIVG